MEGEMEREKRRGSRMGTRSWRKRRGNVGREEEQEEEVSIKARMINSAQLWRLRGKDQTCDSEDQKTRRKMRRRRRRRRRG